MRYFLTRPGADSQGPYSADDLRTMAEQDLIGPDAKLTEEESGREVTLDEILGEAAQPPPIGEPPPAQPGPFAEPGFSAPMGAPAKRAVPWVLFLVLGGGVCLGGVVILAAILLPVFKSAKVAATRSVALSDMKKIMVGVNVYTADYDDALPPDMSTALAAKPYIEEFVDGTVSFASKAQPDAFLAGNRELSGKNISSFESPFSLMTFFDSKNWDNEKRIVGFLDGSVTMSPGAAVQTASENGFILSR